MCFAGILTGLTTCHYSCLAGAASRLRSGLAVEVVRLGLAGIVCSELLEVLFADRLGEGGIASSFRERRSLFSDSDFLKSLLSFVPERSLCIFSSRALLADRCFSMAAASILAEAPSGSAMPMENKAIINIKFFIFGACNLSQADVVIGISRPL